MLLHWSRKAKERLEGADRNIMKTKHKSGFSLIEVMITALILAILAIGGAASLYHTGASIQIQGNKRIAMEYGISILEALKSEAYFVSRSQTPDAPAVTVETVNGVPLTLTSDLILHGEDPTDPDVGILTNEYVEVDIKVQYGQSADETIHMNSTKVLL